MTQKARCGDDHQLPVVALAKGQRQSFGDVLGTLILKFIGQHGAPIGAMPGTASICALAGRVAGGRNQMWTGVAQEVPGGQSPLRRNEIFQFLKGAIGKGTEQPGTPFVGHGDPSARGGEARVPGCAQGLERFDGLHRFDGHGRLCGKPRRNRGGGDG